MAPIRLFPSASYIRTGPSYIHSLLAHQMCQNQDSQWRRQFEFDMEGWEDWAYFVRVSIVVERSFRSSDAFIATLDSTNICYFGCLASTTSPTFNAPAAFLIHFIGYIDTSSTPASGLRSLQFLKSDFTLIDDVKDTFKIWAYPWAEFLDILGHGIFGPFGS